MLLSKLATFSTTLQMSCPKEMLAPNSYTWQELVYIREVALECGGSQ